MTVSVLILGGGVGGLSAAHELIERGIAVTVLEQRDVAGGKARSMEVQGSAVPPNRPLPGEHGFRFFPGFYRHVIDTMRRIPAAAGGSVADHLVAASLEMLARMGKPPIKLLPHQPRTLRELLRTLRTLFTADTGLSDDDLAFFGLKLWQLMTACPDRALHEFENQSWRDFMDAKQRSPAFNEYFVNGLTRCLVAARADLANVRAGGVVLTQLIYGMSDDTTPLDRLLDGPTSPVWITPWRDHLEAVGVRFEFGQTVTAMACDGQRITGVASRAADGSTRSWTADYYVCALPVEYTAPLIGPALLQADPKLAGIGRISANVYDMVGIQFYLPEVDVPLVHGHLSLIDSPWALTGISQRQFWRGVDFARLGDGHVGGVLSIDISDWDTPGLCFPGTDGKNLTARQCRPDQVALDVWTQLRRSLVPAHGPNPLPEALPRWFIDPGVRFDPTMVANDSQLFVNRVGSWAHRPEAASAVPNLVLASDYVRTYTNLATMEAANEAARRAVNALFQRSGITAAPCGVWPLHTPEVLKPFIEADCVLWKLGKPWRGALE
jgi:uncharacterized protein with NAD-binding domain and iron-sulfur cluster